MTIIKVTGVTGDQLAALTRLLDDYGGTGSAHTGDLDEIAKGDKNWEVYKDCRYSDDNLVPLAQISSTPVYWCEGREGGHRFKVEVTIRDSFYLWDAEQEEFGIEEHNTPLAFVNNILRALGKFV